MAGAESDRAAREVLVERRGSRTCLWVASIGVACAAVASTAQSPKSAASGVYLAAQATAGETVYLQQCASCHGQDLAGIETGTRARRRRIRAALATVRRCGSCSNASSSMPPKAPKSLTAKQYVDVLAYLLSANDFPAGPAELTADRQALDDTTMAATTPTSRLATAAPGAPGARSQKPRETSAPPVEWKTYGGDLASMRYSPLDQINKDNFSKLQVAWRLDTDPFGPRPDTSTRRRR